MVKTQKVGRVQKRLRSEALGDQWDDVSLKGSENLFSLGQSGFYKPGRLVK